VCYDNQTLEEIPIECWHLGKTGKRAKKGGSKRKMEEERVQPEKEEVKEEVKEEEVKEEVKEED